METKATTKTTFENLRNKVKKRRMYLIMKSKSDTRN